MAGKKEIAIEIKIKNIKQIKVLENQLKKLRKEQRELAKTNKEAKKLSGEEAKLYERKHKAVTKASKALREHKKALAGTNKGTKAVTKSSNGMAKQFVKGAAAVGIIIGAFRAVNRIVSSVVSTFTEFEFVMSKVNAVSGATEKEFEGLTKTAEELGRTTFFTATQVGELMLNYSKLGFTAMEIQDAVQPTLDLATATGSDLARAALVAGAAVRGFGLDASETQRVVDVMAVSFSSSAMNIEKWQTSMTKVAPIAKAAGFSIEDTAAIMSKLTDSGIEASIAGTSLRNILLKMQDPTSELSMRFGKTIHSLDELVPAMKQFVSEGGSMADVMEVVDLRQAAAFEQMLTTADGTLELRDALIDANGEGARMAGVIGDTLQGAFLKFTSAIQGVAIAFMEKYSKGMQKAVEGTATFFNKLAKNMHLLHNVVKAVKLIIGVLLAYKTQILASAVWTATATTATNIYSIAVGKATFATKRFIVSLKSFKAALVKTGIGALILAIIDLGYYLLSYNDAAYDALDVTKDIDTEQKNLTESTKTLTKHQDDLIESRKTINELTDDNGKLLNDNREATIRLRNAKIKEASAIRGVNSLLKKNGEELITVKTNTDDVSKAIDNLIKKMGEQALARVFFDAESAIISTKVNVEMALDELRKNMTAQFSFIRDMTDEELVGAMNKLKANDGSFGMWMHELLDVFGFETTEIAVTKMIKSVMDKYGLGLGTMIEGAAPDYIKDSTEKLKTAVIKAADEIGLKDFSLEELLLGDGEKKTKKTVVSTVVTDWAVATKEAMNMIKKALKDGTLAEEDYAAEVAKHKKFLLKLEYDALKDTQKLGKEGLALKGKILDQELILKKENIKKESKLLETQYTKDKLALESQLINQTITQSDFDQQLINLDAAYLDQKAGLYTDNVNYLLQLDNDRFANENRLDALRKQMLQEQVSALGGVGSALTSLAGDNEKLNHIKEAGNKISQAANVISTITTLKTNLETLADGKANIAKLLKNTTQKAGIALDKVDIVQKGVKTGLIGAEGSASLMAAGAKNVDTGSTLANTIATTLSLIPKAISSILTSAMAIPFPLNLIAIVATMALVRKVMKFEEGGIVGARYANGGMVHGKSHAQGGEKFNVGGRVAELEGGEAVINKRSTAMFRNQLSEMNQAGGGVKFADGGLMSSPAFAESQFNAIGQNNILGSMQRQRKVVVVEADITDSQSTVSVIQANATF